MRGKHVIHIKEVYNTIYDALREGNPVATMNVDRKENDR
jgi:hypothetical protein